MDKITALAVDFKGDLFWGMETSYTDAAGSAGTLFSASADNANNASILTEVS